MKMMKSLKLEHKNRKLLFKTLKELEENGQIEKEKHFFQHGTTTVFEHSVQVASTSLVFSQIIPVHVNKRALVRGALLHDYFLYDWHEKDKSHRLHGFYHAGTACHNANRDYELGDIETNIIRRHMFPLNPVPPMCREAWIVCMADKYCAARETAHGLFHKKQRKGEKEC